MFALKYGHNSNMEEVVMGLREEAKTAASRTYAGPFDITIEFDTGTHGVGASPDAIGGYYGLGWEEYFRDAKTGELYKVHCSDGEYGGKSAHRDSDLVWLQRCYEAIVARTHELAAAGVAEICISVNELRVMGVHTHCHWLESAPKKADGKRVDVSAESGVIGYCRGVPVIVDPNKDDELPHRL